MPLSPLPFVARLGLLSLLAPVALPALARALPQTEQASATPAPPSAANPAPPATANPAPPQSANPAAPALALIAERCTVCHEQAQVTAARKSEADWTETVDRMVGYGATLTPAERATVLHQLIRDNGLPPAR